MQGNDKTTDTDHLQDHHMPSELSDDALGAERKGVPMAQNIQAHIGRQLLAVYDEVLHQAVPDRFKLLLDELDRASPPKSGGGI